MTPFEAQAHREPDPEQDARRDVHDHGEPRDRAEAQGEVRDGAARQRAAHAGHQARRPHAPRRHARRGHRDQRRPALGSRPGLQGRQDRRLHHAVLQGRRRAGRPRQVRLPRPEDAHRHRHRAALINERPDLQKVDKPFDIDKIPLDDKRDLPAAASGETTGVFQLESTGMQQLFKDLRPEPLRGHRRGRRALSPGPARQRHGEGLRRLQARSQADREDARPRRPHPRAHVRRHRLPRAGHADRAGARGLLARRRRPAPPRDGQEEARGDGEAEVAPSSTARRATASTRRTPTASSACSSSSRATASTSRTRAAYALITYQTAYLKAHYPVEFSARS